MKKILILIILITASIFPQKDPDAILNKVVNNFKKINDYEVGVKIKIDVEFLKVPDMEARIFYKQPDKLHIESESFALLPRKGLDFSPLSILEKEHTAILEREDNLNGHKTFVIKVIPLGETDDLILSTLWIDKDQYFIRKIESTTKMSGSYLIDLKYSENPEYPLPSKMIFSFEIDKTRLPKGMDGEMRAEKDEGTQEKKSPGKVYVDYFEYKINQGIPDKVFEKK
jgi:outer membrane lipoprotein-sorting protein